MIGWVCWFVRIKPKLLGWRCLGSREGGREGGGKGGREEWPDLVPM